jgi:hypothetical protein
VRVQRRVRMGMKDELGSPYILSPSSDHMTIYLYLFGSLHFLIRPFWFICYCVTVAQCSGTLSELCSDTVPVNSGPDPIQYVPHSHSFPSRSRSPCYMLLLLLSSD